MFRLWGKIMKDNHLLADHVAEIDDYSLSRTKMVFRGLEEICFTLDLQVPLWLDPCIKDFKRHARCRFGPDSFVESVDFDYLEIHVIEE